MALIVAGERSGVGKTTVTLALLAALERRGKHVQSFKVGPDYIDPMFHRSVTGRPCRNLDPVLTSETYVQQCFARHTQAVDYALIEGVMGLFDGATGENDWASTAHVARLLELPVLLVLDCSRLARSIAAIAHGYQTFEPQLKIAGWVLNRVGSDRHLELLRAALAPLHLPILGVLHRQDGVTIPDRHLGLVPTAELPGLRSLLDQFAHIGEACFEWAHLLPLLRTGNLENQEVIPGSPSPSTGGGRGNSLRNVEVAAARTCNSKPNASPGNIKLFSSVASSKMVRLAIAQDPAFSFYYADNLDLLEQLGAELLPWSPLSDPALPDGTQGLYFGGGFPEQFAQNLAENTLARDAVCVAIRSGMPTYAECGGLMYLGQSLGDLGGQDFPMVGVLPTTTVMAPRLTLGYRQAIALQNSPLISMGTTVWGHEFHRSRLTTEPEAPLFRTLRFAQDQAEIGIPEGWQIYQLHASYVHLHWGDRPKIPQRFLQHCAAWQRQ